MGAGTVKYVLTALFLLLSVTYAEAASRFAVCTAACTWDASSTLMWSTSTGGATGASVPGSSDAVILDGATCVGGVTCTITVNTTVTVQSINMSACTASTTGCILDFSVNNNSVTLSAAAPFVGGGGSATQTIKMGSGIFTATSVTATWTSGTSVNLTVVPGTSTIAFSNISNTFTQSRTFNGNNKTYYNISIGSTTGEGTFIIANSGNTFNSISITPPNFVQLTFANTLTSTTGFNWLGTSTNQIFITSSNFNAQAHLSSATNSTLQWVAFRAIDFIGGGVGTATNSFDGGGTAGVTITPPGAAGGACILGGWLLWRDMPEHLNDNFPAWLEKAA